LDAIKVVKLFLSFKDKNGSDSYFYLFNLCSFIYEITRQNGFIFDVAEYEDGYYTHLKVMDSLEDIKERLELLYKSAPQIVVVEHLEKTAI
jgi:hypothetical protein